MINRIKKALKSKSGASIVFVLGVMMFLMAIGVSTMAAGMANNGALMRQNEYNRILLLSKSVHDNIMFSLQADPSNPDLLGYQLAYAIFNAYESEPENPTLDDINDMTIQISTNGGESVSIYPPAIGSNDMIYVSDVVFIFPIFEITESKAIDFDPIYTEDGTTTPDRIPRTVTVNVRMVVEIEVIASERHIATRAIYEYRNGILSEVDTIDNVTGAQIRDMQFEADGYGVWVLVSYEIIEI